MLSIFNEQWNGFILQNTKESILKDKMKIIKMQSLKNKNLRIYEIRNKAQNIPALSSLAISKIHDL